MSALGVREGELLAGKYRVERVLGAGGMGVVVAAHHVELDERVAIKFLRPEALTQTEAVARFAREARAAVKIKSEHVARVTDVGKLEDGAPYMVMEYLEGADLASWLAQQGPLPIEQVVEFVLQACEAVAEAHALGIVHRDLKPSNLFVIRRPDGALSIKVLDFGISKTTGIFGQGPSASLAATTGLMGSPLYMSPEQMASSRDVDARTDIWALGVVLYELVSGTPPFVAPSFPELVLRVVKGDPPPPLRGKRPDAPVGFEEAVLRCLVKDRSARYPSILELSRALAPFGPKRARISLERISGVMGVALSSTSASSEPPAAVHPQRETEIRATTGTAMPWAKTSVPRGRSAGFSLRDRPTASLVIFGGVVLLGVGGGVAWFRVSGADVSAASSASTNALPMALPDPVRPPTSAPVALPAPEVVPAEPTGARVEPRAPAPPDAVAHPTADAPEPEPVVAPAASSVSAARLNPRAPKRPAPAIAAKRAPETAAAGVAPKPVAASPPPPALSPPSSTDIFDDRK